jgi:hypothetical protein
MAWSEPGRGVGSFVLRAEPVPRPVDVLAKLRAAGNTN